MNLSPAYPTLTVAIVSRRLPESAWLQACIKACAPYTCLLVADNGFIPVDAVLIDGADPDALHSVARYAAGPVILLSDDTCPNLDEPARQAGALACLPKNGLTSAVVRAALQTAFAAATSATRPPADPATRPDRNDEQIILYETMLALNRQPDLTALLSLIVEHAAALLHAQMGGLYLTRPNGIQLELVVSHNLPGSAPGIILNSGEGVSGRVLQTGQTLLVNDYAHWEGRAAAFASAPIRRLVAVPMQDQGRIVGVIDISDDRPGSFSPHEIQLVQIFAEQAALAVQKTRLLEAAQRRAHELTILTEVSTALRAAGSVNQILEIALQRGLEILDGAIGLIALPGSDRPILFQRAGQLLEYLPAVGEVAPPALREQIITTANLPAQPDVWLAIPAQALVGVTGLISLPLRAETQWVGVMQLGVVEERPFNDVEIRLLTALAAMTGSALGRAMLTETLEQRVRERNQELEARYRELAEAHERLKELDRLKDRFVSDVSHELRTPVTALGLHLDLLERGRPEKRAHYLATMRLEVDRLRQLVMDVLKLSRWDLGRVSVAFGQVDLNQLVARESALLLPRAEAAGVSLEVTTDPDLPPVWGEPTQLAELINYLLMNALQYTPAGRIQLATHYLAEQSAVRLVISDTGLGIDPADIPRLFERFFRGQNVRAIPGSGLGLTIAKEIVDLHQGTIQATSVLGTGTTLAVQLPLRLASPT